MSSSSVSIPATATRRRAVAKKTTPITDFLIKDAVLAIPAPNTALSDGDASINLREREPLLNKPTPTANPRPRKSPKTAKSKWLTVTRVFTKNLLLLLIVAGLVQIVRRLFDTNSPGTTTHGIAVNYADLEVKFAQMDSFMKKTSKMIQVQVDVIDRKLDKHIESVKEEMGRRDVGFDKKLSDVRLNLEKQLGGEMDRLLSKEEFEVFVVEYSKGKGTDGVNLDDVRVYAKEIVEKEIEKHAADGLGRVDYAVASGGSRVVKHSEAYFSRTGAALCSMLGMSSVRADAEKMLTPSFGEPGNCFPLKGSSGYVTVKLRNAVVPEAFTLEHVSKSVAYDRSSAPKDCRIYGWLAQAGDLTDVTTENEKMVFLSEFSYDLRKRNAQNFKVLDSVGSTTVVDTIRFDFSSNHGGSSHTCIYRLRVHGHEPSLSMLAAAQL